MAKRKTFEKFKKKYLVYVLVTLFVGFSGVVYHYGLDSDTLLSLSFYENLANPSVKIIRIQEGLRKEQIADIVGDKLGWNEFEKNAFINAHIALNSENLEGKYFPKTYIMNKDEDPLAVTSTMLHEFSKQTEKVTMGKSSKITNPDTALKIASIIQREAAGKGDMKLISGIIWNRLFSGMKLQIDATLQYAKGTEEDGWWGQVDPTDKSIDSPYNTYANKGLPPSPIANPGLAALEAAYNPQKTSCLYYMHDKKGRIHCTKTYEEHKRNIEIYY